MTAVGEVTARLTGKGVPTLKDRLAGVKLTRSARAEVASLGAPGVGLAKNALVAAGVGVRSP